MGNVPSVFCPTPHFRPRIFVRLTAVYGHILRLELPEVIEIIESRCRAETIASEQPQIFLGIRPTGGKLSGAGSIAGRSGPLGAVRTHLIDQVAAADPCPPAAAVVPQVVEFRSAETLSTMQPD